MGGQAKLREGSQGAPDPAQAESEGAAEGAAQGTVVAAVPAAFASRFSSPAGASARGKFTREGGEFTSAAARSARAAWRVP
eukprot:586872-Prorocentrum_minimum.AAC.1